MDPKNTEASKVPPAQNPTPATKDERPHLGEGEKVPEKKSMEQVNIDYTNDLDAAIMKAKTQGLTAYDLAAPLRERVNGLDLEGEKAKEKAEANKA